MAINFPDTPVVNDSFTAAGRTWIYDGVAWVGAPVSFQVEVADITDLTATATELNFVDGVTSALQAQLDAKAASIHAHLIADIADLTATSAEINFVDGVTSPLQAQLDAKASLLNAALVSPVLTSALESAIITSSPAAGTVQVDFKTSAVKFFTVAATSNWTFNIRGDASTTINSLLSVGQSATVAILVTTGATPYYPAIIMVDGTTVTPRWQGGSAPTAGNASSVDSYTFTILKTGDAQFSVFASQVQFA